MSWGGFKLGGLTALELNVLMRDGEGRPALPTTRDKVVTIPGRNGVYYFGSDLAEMRFSLPCVFIFSGDKETLALHVKQLADHLVDPVTNRPRKLQLIFEDDQTIVYDVYYSGLLDVRRLIFSGEFDLPLMAPDPFGQPYVEPPPPVVPPVIIDPPTSPQEQKDIALSVNSISFVQVAYTFEVAKNEAKSPTINVSDLVWIQPPTAYRSATEDATASLSIDSVTWDEAIITTSDANESQAIAASVDLVSWDLPVIENRNADESIANQIGISNMTWTEDGNGGGGDPFTGTINDTAGVSYSGFTIAWGDPVFDGSLNDTNGVSYTNFTIDWTL